MLSPFSRYSGLALASQQSYDGIRRACRDNLHTIAIFPALATPNQALTGLKLIEDSEDLSPEKGPDCPNLLIYGGKMGAALILS